jgi:hypothetical protein
MKLASVQLLAALIASASALHIPFERRAPIKRAGNQPSSSDPYYFENLSDLLYVGTIYIEGQPFEVNTYGIHEAPMIFNAPPGSVGFRIQ